MTINERFTEILKVKNISVKEAALMLEKSEGYVRKLMIPGQSFGIEPVKTILNSMEDINPDWLLNEKGEMLRETYLSTNTEGKKEELSHITNERLFSIIESQQRTIENLSKK